MHENVVDPRGPLVNVLNFLRRDVLPLLQLENVLLPVDDLQRVVGPDEPDVAAVEPAVLVDGLSGLLRWGLKAHAYGLCSTR